MTILIREATSKDAEALAQLATQLGYPAQAGQIARRMQALAHDRSCVLAGDANRAVVGWIHIEVYGTILLDNVAEILGLVVDERWRGQRVGQALLRAAEEWAAERGCTTVHVRSNVVRDRAYRFYLQNGFQQVKTSFTFAKTLTP
jgi:GNAT superfamily N-acetyltransferase